MLTELSGSVLVHDRYQVYDSPELGELTHQLCTQHLLRDLDDAAEVYPDAARPAQIADALRGLIHQANQARQSGAEAIDTAVHEQLITQFRRGVKVGLAETSSTGTRPGQRKARSLLQVLRDREADVLRFAHDLRIPATSNQAESDLRPSKTQQKISRRLILQPQGVMFEALSLVVASSGSGLVPEPPGGPVFGVRFWVFGVGVDGPESSDFVAGQGDQLVVVGW